MEEFLTLVEALELAKASKATLYRLVGEGKLTIYKIGGGKRTYFKRGELLNLFAPGSYQLEMKSPGRPRKEEQLDPKLNPAAA
jgi:excisionase family DNA binding protein